MVRKGLCIFCGITQIQEHQDLLVLRKTKTLFEKIRVKSVYPAAVHTLVCRGKHKMRCISRKYKDNRLLGLRTHTDTYRCTHCYFTKEVHWDESIHDDFTNGLGAGTIGGSFGRSRGGFSGRSGTGFTGGSFGGGSFGGGGASGRF